MNEMNSLMARQDLTHRTLLYRLRKALCDVILPKEQLLSLGHSNDGLQIMLKALKSSRNRAKNGLFGRISSRFRSSKTCWPSLPSCPTARTAWSSRRREPVSNRTVSETGRFPSFFLISQRFLKAFDRFQVSFGPFRVR